jgi:GntR family transcriptional regulator, trehalose operon transcriptional repressor
MTPKYIRIKQKLLDMIKDLPEGSRIPSERDLVNKFDGSRMTIRKSIDELVKSRALYRINGSGTFVAKGGHRKYLNNLVGFSKEVLEQGGIPSHRVIKLKSLKADAKLASKLEISVGDPVDHVVRVHERDGEPVLVDYAYFNTKVTKKLTKKLCEGSLYKYFEEKLGLKITTSIQEFFAEIVSEEIIKFLSIEPDTPIIKLENITFLDDGSVLEYTIGYRNPLKYRQITIANK